MKLIYFIYIISFIIACNSGQYRIDDEDVNCVKTKLENRSLVEIKCYYGDGKIKEVSYWINDSIQTNEQLLFYKSGKIKEYHFYDLAGYRRFSRYYNDNGKLVEEKGDVLSHERLSSYETKIGDSVVVEIFVATPPGCSFKVYGLNSEGRYNVNNTSDIEFISKHIIRPSKPGDYVFVYEFDFTDTLNNSSFTRKSEVSFKIIH
jgi:hypothetical protein